MRVRLTFGITFLLLLVAQSSVASNSIHLHGADWLLQDSIESNPSLGTIDFSIWNSEENIATSYSVNFTTGEWVAADSDGHFQNGSVPAELEAAWVPA